MLQYWYKDGEYGVEKEDRIFRIHNNLYTVLIGLDVAMKVSQAYYVYVILVFSLGPLSVLFTSNS